MNENRAEPKERKPKIGQNINVFQFFLTRTSSLSLFKQCGIWTGLGRGVHDVNMPALVCQLAFLKLTTCLVRRPLFSVTASVPHYSVDFS